MLIETLLNVENIAPTLELIQMCKRHQLMSSFSYHVAINKQKETNSFKYSIYNSSTNILYNIDDRPINVTKNEEANRALYYHATLEHM